MLSWFGGIAVSWYRGIAVLWYCGGGCVQTLKSFCFHSDICHVIQTQVRSDPFSAVPWYRGIIFLDYLLYRQTCIYNFRKVSVKCKSVKYTFKALDKITYWLLNLQVMGGTLCATQIILWRLYCTKKYVYTNITWKKWASQRIQYQYEYYFLIVSTLNRIE